MTALITALAQAHGRIIATLEASDTPDEGLASTGRKIEGTILALLAGLASEDLEKLAFVILESGSLKALKMLPEKPLFARGSYSRNTTASAFVLARKVAYRKAAEKRGFALTQDEVGLMLSQFLSGTTDPNMPGISQALASTAPRPYVLMESLARFFVKPSEDPHDYEDLQPIQDAQKSAALLAPALKAALRDSQVRKTFEDDLERLCVLPKPELAAQGLYHTMATYAMLGIKKPHKDRFEHEKVRSFVDAIFSPEGRKTLLAHAGSIEDWLGGGWRTPSPEVATMEALRLNWRPPYQARRAW